MIPVTLKYMILADYDEYIKALVACWSELTYKFTTGGFFLRPRRKKEAQKYAHTFF